MQVAATLNARDFVVDFRPGVGVRLSPHFYNTMDEIDAMMHELDRVARANGRTSQPGG
jgi:selenocysteine lyase/cysteine desulfurase